MKSSLKLFLIILGLTLVLNGIVINFRIAALTETVVGLERRTALLQQQVESRPDRPGER